MPETVRDQSILALMAFDCPSIDTLCSMHVIIKEESDTPVCETASLAMGALLTESRRICNKKIGLHAHFHFRTAIRPRSKICSTPSSKAP